MKKKEQQEDGGGGVAPAITSDERASEWMITIHDTIYRDIDHYAPSLDPTGRYLIDVQPNSYTPLPWCRPDGRLFPSIHYKLDSAARARIKFGLPDFPLLIGRLQDLTPRIRAFYPHQLTVSDHDLACVMAIDGLFLLDLLVNYREKKDTLQKMDVLFKSNHRRLIGDILSPRNCFPFFLLEEMISLTGNPDDRYLLLPHRLLDFCADVSPFPLPPVYPAEEMHPPLHLLDLLYRLVLIGNSNSNSGRSRRLNSNSDSDSGRRGRSFCRRLADAVFELLDIPRLVREHREEYWSAALTPPANWLKDYGSIRFEPVSGFKDMRFDSDRGVMYLPEVNLQDPNSGEVMRILLEYESYLVSDNSKRILHGYHALMGSLGYYDGSLAEASVVLKPLAYNYEFAGGSKRVDDRQNFRRMDKVGEMVEAVNSYYDASFWARSWMMGCKLCVALFMGVGLCLFLLLIYFFFF